MSPIDYDSQDEPRILHPVGTFESSILDHGFSKTSDKGSLFFWARFRTESGEIVGRFYLTGGATEYTLEKIVTMGFQGEDLVDLADGKALAGSECQITVEHEHYEGRTRARVGFVNPAGFEGFLDHDVAAAANAKQFNALLKTVRAKAAQRNQSEEAIHDIPI